MFKPLTSACPACGNKEITAWRNKVRLDQQFSIWRCAICKTAFLNPQPTKDFLNSIYQFSGLGLSQPISFNEVIATESEYPNATVDAKRLVIQAKRYMPNHIGLKALDIGSGYGFFSRAALQAGFTVTAINPGIWENAVFEEMNGLTPISARFEDVDFAERFDLVILSQVLEHVENPFDFLLKIRAIMATSGVLAIAVPNVDSILVKVLGTRDNSCLWVPEHLTFFSTTGLMKILQRSGFLITRHEYISRIPYYALSNRLKLTGAFRRLVNYVTRFSQRLPLKLVDLVGVGFYHNVWAEPC
jgi:2-polyprenyl-3-methyl-5-hydroxy-6-metoxy-1,4-benzoquinol methylase